MTKLMPAPTEPMAVARELIKDFTTEDGCLKLRYWRGDWLRWDGSRWTLDEEAARRAHLYRHLADATYIHVAKTRDGETRETRRWQPNRRKIADVIDALAAIVHLPEFVESPSWIDTTTPPYPASEVVACQNGLLHVPTRTVLPATPKFFSRVSVPFDYDPDAPEPKRWIEFLGQLWPDDLADQEQAQANVDAVKALQEAFGYFVSGRSDLQKIPMLIGPTRGGKGVVARTLTGLIGHGNVAAPTLPSLGTNFGLQPLIGKTIAIVSDARIDGISTTQIAERLLSISGEDSVTIDRKYLPTWTGKLPTRFLILSNELPRFGDASAAIAHRFLILNLQVSFLGKENPHLTDELREELPGILLWALDGLDRLTAQGRFTMPKTSIEATAELVNIASPATAFVRDECEVGADKSVPVKELFDAWREWCEEGDHKSGDVQKFGRDLRAVVAGLKRSKIYVDKVRIPHFVGVTLRVGRDAGEDKKSKHHNAEGRGPSRPKPVTSDDAEAVTRPTNALSQPENDGPRWAATPPIVEPTRDETPPKRPRTVEASKPKPLKKRCEVCRKSFTPKRADAKYCSPAHRTAAYAQRKKDGS
ncbi:phage/plasmid primase, P4 family [Streptosporangium sp. NPDC023963]|uniref:DNA primase family protein n=1 Tax=Streptosporangium sp. NPDC023963 TaxID=3155608 RepID=UPI00342EBEFC